MEKVLYFFDQPCPRRGSHRRKQKFVDDVYGINSSSSYLQSGRRDSAKLSEFSTNRSLLPEIKQAVSLLKQQLDGLFGDGEGVQRLMFEEARLTAPDLLSRLEIYVDRFVDIKPSIPATLQHDLNSTWNDLITDADYTVREWQCLKIQETEEEQFETSPRESASPATGFRLEPRPIISHQLSNAGSEAQGAQSKDLLSAPSGRKSIVSHRSTLADLTGVTDKKDVQSSSRKSITKPPKSHLQPSLDSVRSASAEGSQKIVTQPVPKFLTESKAGSNQAGYSTQIQFQLSSKACRDKGWITNSNHVEPEITIDKVLRQVTERLRMVIKEEKDLCASGKDPESNVCLFRFYGDNLRQSASKSKWSGSVTAQGLQMLKGLKPQIPPLTMAIGTGKTLFRVSMLDGSSIVYYPSGHVAVTHTRPGQPGLPGYYTVVYDDEPSQRMLASFTPSGKGCCYHSDGTAWVVAVEGGYFMGEPGGRSMEKFSWPQPGAKLATPLALQLNQKVMFRGSSRQSMQLTFSWQGQSAKFYVGLSPGAEKTPTRDDLGCLLSTLEFVSKTAHSFTTSQYQRLIKQKNKFKMTARMSLASDIGAELCVPPTSPENIGVNKDNEITGLKLLESKIRTLLDEWLAYYRSTLGVLTPETSAPDGSLDSDVLLTESSQDGRESRADNDVLSLPRHLAPVRHLSAPSGELAWKSPRNVGPSFQSVKFAKSSNEIGEIRSSSLQQSVGVQRSRVFIIRPVSAGTLGPVLGRCPAKLRQAMLGELDMEKNCPHRTVPFLTDVEFDDFLRKFIPENQLAVIGVFSSQNPKPTSSSNAMLQCIHEKQHRTRLWPCFQSHFDAYRIFLYDIATAAEHSGEPESLLTRRHNVTIGMFLMYKGGQLRFCNHIFNGYGTNEKDFFKQLDATNVLAENGHILPNNFRFSPQIKVSCSQHTVIGDVNDRRTNGKLSSLLRTLSGKSRTDFASRVQQRRQTALDQVIGIASVSNATASHGPTHKKINSDSITNSSTMTT